MDVPYGTEDPSRQLMNIALPEQGGETYGVMLFHHAAGGTHYSVGKGQVDAAHNSGYALVSWESVKGEILMSWSYAETCFAFVRANANEYGWDPDFRHKPSRQHRHNSLFASPVSPQRKFKGGGIPEWIS